MVGKHKTNNLFAQSSSVLRYGDKQNLLIIIVHSKRTNQVYLHAIAAPLWALPWHFRFVLQLVWYAHLRWSDPGKIRYNIMGEKKSNVQLRVSNYPLLNLRMSSLKEWQACSSSWFTRVISLVFFSSSSMTDNVYAMLVKALSLKKGGFGLISLKEIGHNEEAVASKEFCFAICQWTY